MKKVSPFLFLVLIKMITCCPICIEPISVNNYIRTPCCGNLYCSPDYLELIERNSTCPTCRGVLPKNLEEHNHILQNKPESSWVLTDLAIHFLPQEDKLTNLSKALLFETVDPIAYYSLADVYYDCEDYAQAIVYYNKSIELGFVQAYVRLYLITNEHEYLELGGKADDPFSLYILGCHSASKKEWDKSSQYLKKCASISKMFSKDERLITILRLCEL